MIVSHMILKNWRNFQAVDVTLQERVFLVGPNADRKSVVRERVCLNV